MTLTEYKAAYHINLLHTCLSPPNPTHLPNSSHPKTFPGLLDSQSISATIFFLSHVFFLISVVQYPYFHFAPSHEETHHYLLAFRHTPPPLSFLSGFLSHHRTVSLLDYLSHNSHVFPTFHRVLWPSTYVTISFLSHVFFLISVVWRPYFFFAPSYEETDHYLLAFPLYSSLVFPL